MTTPDKPKIGAILWQDLTVDNAESVRDFYSQVVGWTHTEQDMGGYADYNMNAPESGETVAGICHAKGTNASLPPQWLVYIMVSDVAQSIKKCLELGGRVIDGPRDMDGSQFCVIQDPAGAVAGLISQ
ncbi:MAG: VOC family protein [Chloroflexi bacterium]|nr:VOC family protein [Chloroflexota bacterium]MDA1219719.1 VOC family protein [Chloroflexota bacterium]